MMKTTFTCAILVAMASAQTEEVETQMEQSQIASLLEELVEQNDQGQWQLNLPELPKLSFTEVSEEQIQNWVKGKEAIYSDLDSQWVGAWNSYMDAIAQPWNDFLTESEKLSAERDQLDIQTTEEAIKFVAENTFIDGQSLKDLYPQVESFLQMMEQEANSISERFNLDAFKVTPRVLVTEVEADDETSEMSDSQIGQVFTQIQDSLMTYGYDPEIVSQWLNNKGTSWEDLFKAQDMQRQSQAKADIAEAADYIKGILDNVMSDVNAQVSQAQADFEAELDAKVTDLKSQVDQKAQDTIDQLNSWIEQAYSETQLVTEETVVLAQVDVSGDVSDNSVRNGFAALTIGAAAAVAFALYKKRDGKTFDAASDEGYHQV